MSTVETSAARMRAVAMNAVKMNAHQNRLSPLQFIIGRWMAQNQTNTGKMSAVLFLYMCHLAVKNEILGGVIY